MKHLTFEFRRILPAGAALLLSLAWPSSASVPTSGLVASYTFTGNAQDAGPYALHGSVHGATLTLDRFGYPGRAYRFNGTSNYIELPDNPHFSVPTTGNLSISVWLRPDTLQFPDYEGSGYVHWFGKGTSGQQEWTFRMYNLTNDENRPNRTSFYLFNLTGGLGAGSYVQEAVTAGTWSHYVAVVNSAADTITLYKDGVQRDQDPFHNSQYNITPQDGTAPVRIGTRDFNSYFKGAIDDIYIYDRVLTPAEIQQLYLDGKGSGSKLAVPGTSVSASADDGNVPANTVDGNLSTRWSAQGNGQWIQYDLGSTRTVSYVKIAWYQGDARVATFDVQVSPNGTSWTNVLTGAQSSGVTTALETYDFTDTSARYVRIVGHGNSVNAWNSITETELWGL